MAPRRTTTLTTVNYNKYRDTDINKNTTETSQEHQEDIRKASREHIDNNVNNVNNVNNNTRDVVNSEMNSENPQLKELIQLHQSCGFGLIMPYSAKVLDDYMARYSFEWVKEAIEISEQDGIRTLAYTRDILSKKKAGTDKPRNNNFGKRETYYRPKQDNELSEKSRNLNNKVLNSSIKRMKREDAKSRKKEQV